MLVFASAQPAGNAAADSGFEDALAVATAASDTVEPEPAPAPEHETDPEEKSAASATSLSMLLFPALQWSAVPVPDGPQPDVAAEVAAEVPAKGAERLAVAVLPVGHALPVVPENDAPPMGAEPAPPTPATMIPTPPADMSRVPAATAPATPATPAAPAAPVPLPVIVQADTVSQSNATPLRDPIPAEDEAASETTIGPAISPVPASTDKVPESTAAPAVDVPPLSPDTASPRVSKERTPAPAETRLPKPKTLPITEAAPSEPQPESNNEVAAAPLPRSKPAAKPEDPIPVVPPATAEPPSPSASAVPVMPDARPTAPEPTIAARAKPQRRDTSGAVEEAGAPKVERDEKALPSVPEQQQPAAVSPRSAVPEAVPVMPARPEAGKTGEVLPGLAPAVVTRLPVTESEPPAAAPRRPQSEVRVPRMISTEAPAAAPPGEVVFTGKLQVRAVPKPIAEAPKPLAEPRPEPALPGPVAPAHMPAETAPNTAVPAPAALSGPDTKAEIPVPTPPARVEPPVEPRSAGKPLQPHTVETMNVTVGAHGEARAEVRITQRNGTIEMAVRTPHAELAQTLRAALPELGSALESHGFRADIREATPAAAASGNRAAAQSEDPDTGGHKGRPSHEWNEDNQERRQRRPFERYEDD